MSSALQPIVIHYHWIVDRDWDDCNLCGEYRLLNHSVAFYEQPVHLEIGSLMPNGDEVGGMLCCKECHDNHYGVEHDRSKTNLQHHRD